MCASCFNLSFENSKLNCSTAKIPTRLGHKSMEKNSARNLQYGLRIRLIRSIYGAPMKTSELFCFKDKKNFAALLFFVAACNKNFQRANATGIA